MSRWQPISTAPRDGTHILVCAPSVIRPALAAYDVSGWARIGLGDLHYEPTHWQPLPAVPSVLP